jgi:hypothetical protein
MESGIIESSKRLKLAAAAVLLIGLSSGLAIYLAADDDAGNMLVDEFLNSKKYRHEVEAYGGKASLLADEFSRWFQGLWHGKTLGITVGCITLLVAVVLALIARHSPFDET